MSNPYRHFNTGEASKYDDFDPKKNYVKVLYNPSRAVQARELTQGQTYLNHQIAAMGGYLFQDGQPIDGAKISFSENQPIVNVAFAVPPSDIKATLDSVVGEVYYTTASTGQSIIITGYEIINNEYYLLFSYRGGEIWSDTYSGTGYTYLKSDTNKANDKQITFIMKEAPQNALVASCTEGTIFVDGYFIYVPRSEVLVAPIPREDKILSDGTKLIDTYRNTEYHIGFSISRKEVTPTDDISLHDNAIGSYNYKAPGANRYQIQATLSAFTKETMPVNKEESGIDFIAGIAVKNGVLIQEQPLEYDSSLRDMLARRTYEESGSYAVTPWDVTTDTLLDSDEVPLESGDTSVNRDEWYGVNVSPGLGYVYGYRVSNLITNRLLNRKPRTKIKKEDILNYVSDGMYTIAGKKEDGTIDASKFPSILSTVTILNTPLNNIDEVTINDDDSRIIGYCLITDLIFEGDNLKIYLTNADKVLNKFETARCLVELDKNNKVKSYVNLYLKTKDGNIVYYDNTQTQKKYYYKDDKEEKIFIDNDNVNAFVYGTPVGKIIKTEYTMIAPYFSEEEGDILKNSLDYECITTFKTSIYGDGISIPTSSQNEVKRIVYVYNEATGQHLDVSKGYFNSAHNIWISEEVLVGASYVVCAVYERQNYSIRTKSLENITETKKINSDDNSIELSQEDVYDITEVRIIAVNEESSTQDSINYKDNLTLLNTQTDFFYKKGQLVNLNEFVSLVKKNNPDMDIDSITITITYRYFEHSGVGPFTVSSYLTNDNRVGIDYKDIPFYRSSTGEVYRLRDCLDFRVKESEINKSNLSLITYKSSIRYDVAMYLPRVDSVWVDKTGKFGITRGIPSLTPEAPDEKDGTMTLYYLYNDAYGENVSLKYVNNKRHTMSDITKLENRLTNVENVLTLSMLEQSAVNMQITDEEGLNRYKSGIFTDNFSSYDNSNCMDENWNCSIDAVECSVRPDFECENLEFVYDKKGTNVSTWGDGRQRDENGNVVIKLNEKEEEISVSSYPDNILTLSPKKRVLWASNTACSEATNIQSLMFYVWTGELKLTPSIDTWVKDLGNKLVATNYKETPKPKTTYRSWSVSSIIDTKKTSKTSYSTKWDSSWSSTGKQTATTTTTTTNTIQTKKTTETTSYSGSWEMSEQYESKQSNDTYMRVRDVRFRLKGMRPGIQVKATLDDKPLTLYSIRYITDDKWEKTSTINNKINSNGELEGCFTIPKNMTCGTKLVQFYDDEGKTAASAEYTANGKTVWTEVTRNYIRTWTAMVSTQTQTSISKETKSEVTGTKVTTVYRDLDPISESFYVDSPNGIMLESIDVFFAKKDENVNVEIIVVECENGYPGQTMVPFSRVVKTPDEVVVTPIETVGPKNKPKPTNFKFESPLYLHPETEYAFIVIAQSYNYEIYTSTLGKADLITGIGIKEQPYIGSMFKSQNLRTWTAEQLSDITFNMYKYEFDVSKNGKSVFEIVPLKDDNGNAIDFKSTMQTLALNSFVPSQTDVLYEYSWNNDSARNWIPFNNKEDIFNTKLCSTYEIDDRGRPINTNRLRIRCTLSTLDKNISPMIDLEQVYGIFTNNKVKAIENPSTEKIVEFYCGSYVSNNIRLENAGEDLRVILDAILPKKSRIAVSYKTIPIIQQYFLTGTIGACHNINDNVLESLSNKTLQFFECKQQTDNRWKMTPIVGESKCMISYYDNVIDEEVIREEVIDAVTKEKKIKVYTSAGRLYVKALSNDTIIKDPVKELEGTENVGYFLFALDKLSNTIIVENWKQPVYSQYDVVTHKGKLWIAKPENGPGFVQPGTEGTNPVNWRKPINNGDTMTKDNIPAWSETVEYEAWSLVEHNGNYYVSKTKTEGNRINTSDWTLVENGIQSWCYPAGTYVFYNDYLWKVKEEEKNAEFNEPSDKSELWEKINGIKIISPVKEKEDAEWRVMIRDGDTLKETTTNAEENFIEYSYKPKLDVEEEFSSFALKIDLYSQDEVNVPRVKNLRAIALI
jgi:hypothetical protein